MSECAAGLLHPSKGSAEEWREFAEISTDIAFGRLTEHWFNDADAMTKSQISNSTASAADLSRVQKINADSFWGLFQEQGDEHQLIAFYGQLLLNKAGETALLNRTLDHHHPQAEYLCNHNEYPSAVYIWCIVAKKKLAILQAALIQQLRDRQVGIPYFTTLATEDSMRIGRQTGLTPVTAFDDRIGGLYRLPAIHPILRKPEDPQAYQIVVKIVERQNEFEMAMAIRRAVFVMEQSCPENEEFDGNDFSAQHLICLVNGEPAATMRIRYFGRFAKWERFCVEKAFRKGDVANAFLSYAEALVRRKGFEHIYFQAEPALTAFWEKRGFNQKPNARKFVFSDRDYVEFGKTIPASSEAVSSESDPLLLNRVEGLWDEPGVLDRSAARAKKAVA